MLSPQGDRAYVSARGSDALLVFDTEKVKRSDPYSLIAAVPVGRSPVGVSVAKDGALIVVTASDRFTSDANAPQHLTFVDATKIVAGGSADGTGDMGPVLGMVMAGAFPRELYLTPDGGTLLVSNARSQSLDAINLSTIKLDPPK
jgi:DNA-binding beta-propeller fold protein YncE